VQRRRSCRSAKADPAHRQGGVILVHAHPDDEVFATAAATITFARQGVPVRLRIFTGGEASTLDACGGDAERARDVRTAQLARSCALLGIGSWDYVTRPGQWIDSHAGDIPTVAGEDPRVLARAVRAQIDRLTPAVVLTVGRDGLTGHPDHVAVSRAVRGALGMPGWRPRAAWGAVLLEADVVAAHELALTVFPGRVVGSGRVSGRPPGAVGWVADCGADGEQRRRLALDQYTPGLGTMPHGRLAQTARRLGDSVLLRILLDASSWRIERYEAIAF
jgi:LmbE family N-acetylglucosaminyl deacetylase